MVKERIENLAQEVKEKSREAAEKYGRDQYYAEIIATRGKEVSVALILDLQKNVDAFRRHLQGDPASAETSVQTVKPEEIRITRARFPWVEARLVHSDDTITRDYAKGPGVEGDPALDRKTRTFALQVAADNGVFVQGAFVDAPQQFRQPEKLPRQDSRGTIHSVGLGAIAWEYLCQFSQKF